MEKLTLLFPGEMIADLFAFSSVFSFCDLGCFFVIKICMQLKCQCRALC